LAARRTEDVNQGPPPELAIAASMIDDPQAALTLARGAVDREPTIAPEVVNNLARRGDTQSPHDFVNEIRDPVKRAAALSALIVGASVKGDAKLPDSYMTELQNLRNDAPVSADQALVLGHLARAQKAAFKDDRWRTTFQLALNAAERADEAARPSLVTGLAAILTSIKTGRSLLD
jgi:hypothetical protein